MSLSNLKILIIEDDTDQRELMRETLEGHFGGGVSVTEAESITAALTQELGGFDLILSDYNLGDGTGMQLLAEIRRRCNTPVIMVTGENVAHFAAEAIRKGATDYVVKFGDYLRTIPLVVEKNLTVAKVMRENDHLRDELQHALDELRDKHVQLEASLKLVEEVAATDPLTGLYNRRHFGKVIDQLYAEAQRYDLDLACVMVDMDGYKQINDHYGHQVGDQLLQIAGRVITANLRRMDVAARYGGDEFILLLPHASAEEAAGVAQRIRDEYHLASAGLLKRSVGATMSMGIGSMKMDDPSGPDQLVANADASLYKAKGSGRDRIVSRKFIHVNVPVEVGTAGAAIVS